MSQISVTHSTSPSASVPALSYPAYHSHPFDEMLLICSGDIIAISPNSYLAHRGACILFYKNNTPHAQINAEGVPYDRFYLDFERNVISEFFSDWSLFSSFSREDAFLIPLEPDDVRRLRAAAQLLEQLNQPGEPDIRQKLLLGYFFAEVTEIGKRQGCTPPSHFYLTPVAEFISVHIAEKLTIDRIASRFHIGRTKLIRDFKEFFSMSIQDFITMERLAQARILLQQGKSVQETAERCGFADSAHFIRVFRRYFHLTPAVYRNQCSGMPARSVNLVPFL